MEPYKLPKETLASIAKCFSRKAVALRHSAIAAECVDTCLNCKAEAFRWEIKLPAKSVFFCSHDCLKQHVKEEISEAALLLSELRSYEGEITAWPTAQNCGEARIFHYDQFNNSQFF